MDVGNKRRAVVISSRRTSGIRSLRSMAWPLTRLEKVCDYHSNSLRCSAHSKLSIRRNEGDKYV